MIYITGDCHADYRKFNTKNFPLQSNLTKQDYVAVCGDFGYWRQSEEREYWMDWLNEKPFTTLFVDGNHEDFDELDALPVEHWKGGKIHRIRDSVYHLMRGQIFLLDDLRIFAFGGARSHDIQGGVLDRNDIDFQEKKKRAERQMLPYRINREDWWEQEMPTQEEMEEGRKNLEAYDWNVDMIVSHCCASSSLVSCALFPKQEQNELTAYFEELKQKENWKA